MSSVFDGLGTICAEVFGAPVTVTPKTGPAFVIATAVLRVEPVETGDELGGPSVLGTSPTLKVPADQIGALSEGATVTQAGISYRIVAGVPSGNPADDGFRIFILEQI